MDIVVIAILGFVCVFLYILWKNSHEMRQSIRLAAQQQSLARHDEQVRILCRAIHILNPNVTPGIDYIIRHDAPDQEPYISEWTADAPRPSNEDIINALKEVSDTHHEERFAALRRSEYPSVGEQLDAAYRARHGDDSSQIEVDEKIRRVKEKYPKAEPYL